MPTGIYVRHPKPIKWHREGDCFRCTSHATASHGYVVIWRNSKLFTIPRLIILRRGQPDSHRTISMHSCDNRWCINPNHISAGTHSDNIRDAWKRQRRTYNIETGRWRNNYTGQNP